MQNYSNEEQNIFEEKRKFLLSLRKNKINFKLFEGRNITKFNNKKTRNIFDENKNITIIDVKSKFNEILLNENTTENGFLNILNELFKYFESFIKYNKDIDINGEIIESSVKEKIYENLILHEYINNEEILLNVLLILSMEIFLYNHFSNLKLYKYKFISEDKYIYLLSLILNSDNEEIIYNAFKFIGLLTKDSKDISEKLFDYKTLEQIINNNQFDNNIEVIKLKIFCISNFELESKFEKDPQLSLKIQNFYISIFNEYILNKEIEKELFQYFIKTIKNLSFCTHEIYIQNLLDSNIISFLINFDKINYSITESLLTIIGNMSIISNEELLSRLHKEVIEYLLNIILKDKINDFLMGLTLWNINNFLESKNLCYDTFFKNNLIAIYKNYILNHEVIEENIFKEICLSYKNLIVCIINSKEYFLFIKHNIITSIIDGFKKIKNINNLEKTGRNIIEALILLFTINDDYISDFNKFTFESKGGNEYIFDKINNIFLGKKNNENNNLSEENNNEENRILKIIDLIKKNLLDN